MTEQVDETETVHEPLSFVKIHAHQYITGKLTLEACAQAKVAEKNHVAK